MTLHSFPAPGRIPGNSMVQPAASSPDHCEAAAMPKYRLLIVMGLAMVTWAVCGAMLLFVFGVIE